MCNFLLLLFFLRCLLFSKILVNFQLNFTQVFLKLCHYS
jgi:hypothetical protein